MVMPGDGLDNNYGCIPSDGRFNAGLGRACQSANISLAAEKQQDLSGYFGMAAAGVNAMPSPASVPASPAMEYNPSFGK